MPIDVKQVQGLYFICQEVQQKLGCVNFQALLTLFSLCSQETESKVRVNCLLSEALFLCCTQSDVLIQCRDEEEEE